MKIIFFVIVCCTIPALPAADDIHTAAWAGNGAKVDSLLKTKPDLVNSKTSAGLTPLHLATVLGQSETAAALIAAKADVNAKDEAGRTPLHLAARHGSLAIAQQLLAHGAAIDEKDKEGQTPLHCAAICGQTEIAKLLVEKNAKLNEATTAWPWQGFKPLSLAVMAGADDIVALLLEKNAELAYKDQNQSTLLHLAVNSKSIATLQRLLKLGKLDINAGDYAKRTALLLACDSQWLEGSQLLLDSGAKPNLCDANGNSPLHTQSVFSGSMEMAQLLLKYKADPNLQGGKELTTCLHLAVSWGGHAALIPVLLEHGANPNLKNAEGLTPLHSASENGYKENAKLLLDKGADTSIKDNKGLTPADVAHKNDRIGKDYFELLDKYSGKK